MAAEQADDAFVLLLWVNEDLFKSCFGADEKWPCKLVSLSENCTHTMLMAAIESPSIRSVVVQDEELQHWDALVEYYRRGGTVIYFGIYGVYSTPAFLSIKFGLKWSFSAYTTYEYLLTPTGIEVLGDAITYQQYTKSNLLHVPEEDRLMIPKVYNSFEEFREENYDSDDEDNEIVEKYKLHQDDLCKQVPLAMHRCDTGGRVAYLGFVNGDGRIPEIVRALCSQTKTPN